MSIHVTREFVSRGSSLLNNAWDEVTSSAEPLHCSIEECIDEVLSYDKAKTYKYILLTQLLGKAVDERVNILAMKASSSLEGSWSARNLCEGAITTGSGFERNVLRGVLGLTKQPYNNAPGQKAVLSKDDREVRSSDIPLRDLLIDSLESVRTSEEAYRCIKYYLSVCENQMIDLESEGPFLDDIFGIRACSDVSRYLSDLAACGGEGEGLALAVALVLRLTLGEELGYEVRLRPVNASRSGEGDVDVFCGSERYATLELKDKPFSLEEVDRYADRARSEKCPRFYFVYGPNAGDGVGSARERTLSDRFAGQGMVAACVPFESMKNSLMLLLKDVDMSRLREILLEYLDDAQIKPATSTYAREELRRLASAE